jgi:hypothetical protein
MGQGALHQLTRLESEVRVFLRVSGAKLLVALRHRCAKLVDRRIQGFLVVRHA